MPPLAGHRTTPRIVLFIFQISTVAVVFSNIRNESHETDWLGVRRWLSQVNVRSDGRCLFCCRFSTKRRRKGKAEPKANDDGDRRSGSSDPCQFNPARTSKQTRSRRFERPMPIETDFRNIEQNENVTVIDQKKAKKKRKLTNNFVRIPRKNLRVMRQYLFREMKKKQKRGDRTSRTKFKKKREKETKTNRLSRSGSPGRGRGQGSHATQCPVAGGSVPPAKGPRNPVKKTR